MYEKAFILRSTLVCLFCALPRHQIHSSPRPSVATLYVHSHHHRLSNSSTPTEREKSLSASTYTAPASQMTSYCRADMDRPTSLTSYFASLANQDENKYQDTSYL
ncbi:hypothetical protein JOL62DRAFT_281192 [Phyllosticta paracitricarpa]|uniref:Uncharacterized protein n=2 Tax=Phyllosticta TaxID=121621 RepID=A0ABR1MQ71_9PEZI